VGFINYHQTKPLILKQPHILYCNRKTVQDLGFCLSVVETSALLECYKHLLVISLPTTNHDMISLRLCIFE